MDTIRERRVEDELGVGIDIYTYIHFTIYKIDN